MTKKNFLQVFAILIFAAFFAIIYTGFFLEPNEMIEKGANVFGSAFEKIVEFFTLTE